MYLHEVYTSGCFVFLKQEQKSDQCWLLWFLFQVTEQVKMSVESQVLEAREELQQLEKKLLEVEKEKNEIQEEKQKAVAATEQQVQFPLCV